MSITARCDMGFGACTPVRRLAIKERKLKERAECVFDLTLVNSCMDSANTV